MKEVEITCEVFNNIKEINEILLNHNLKFIERFTLDDIYMYNVLNNDFYIKNGKISDTLIIRKVNENNIKLVCKRRRLNKENTDIYTNKDILKTGSVEESERFLNGLGFYRYLRMIDTNYMYEDEKYFVYIQEVKGLGIFIEVETKYKSKNEEKEIKNLIEYVKKFELEIGNKFNIRKAELLYLKKNGEK